MKNERVLGRVSKRRKKVSLEKGVNADYRIYLKRNCLFNFEKLYVKLKNVM